MRHSSCVVLAAAVIFVLVACPDAQARDTWPTTACELEVEAGMDRARGPVVDVTFVNPHPGPVSLFPVFRILESTAAFKTGNALVVSFLNRDRQQLHPPRIVKPRDALDSVGPPNPEWFVRLEPGAVFGLTLKLRELFQLTDVEDKIEFVRVELRSDLNQLHSQYPGPYRKIATLPLCTRSASPVVTLRRPPAGPPEVRATDPGGAQVRAELQGRTRPKDGLEIEVAVRNLSATTALWLPARFLVQEKAPQKCPAVEVTFLPPILSAGQRGSQDRLSVADVVRLPPGALLGRRFFVTLLSNLDPQRELRANLSPKVGCVNVKPAAEPLRLLTDSLEARGFPRGQP